MKERIVRRRKIGTYGGYVKGTPGGKVPREKVNEESVTGERYTRVKDARVTPAMLQKVAPWKKKIVA